jgi:hypothetical protein
MDYQDEDYFARHRAEYDPEEAPYEPLAPDLAGQSPMQSWKGTQARPTRWGGQSAEDTGANLRERSITGASPVPEQEQVQAGPENTPYTLPSNIGVEDAKTVVDVMGYKPTSPLSPGGSVIGNFGSKLRALQQYARGAGAYVAERAGSIFARRGE